jgi:hypothetical protein
MTLTTSYQLVKQAYLGNQGYSGGDIYLRTYAKYSSQSIDNNNTVVQVQTRIQSGGTWWASSGTGHTTTANGTSKSGNDLTYSGSMWPKGERTIETLEVTVGHDTDGTKSISVNSYFHSDPWEWSANAGDTVDLPTIPRATVPTVNYTTRELGNAVTISTNRASSSFTHTLNIKDGSTPIETFTNISTSKSWTPTVETYAPKITSGDTKVFTIECETYSGSTLIGTKTCTITLKVPASVKPTAGITIAKGDTVVPSSWGVYVQGKSQLAITVSGTKAYGADITGYSSTVEGTTNTNASYITNTLTQAGQQSVSATVSDARGHASNAMTKNYTVIEYSKPSITEASCQRCDSNGTPKDNGGYLLYTFKGSVSPVSNKNSKIFRIGYKLKSDEDYTYITIESSSYTCNKVGVVLVNGSTKVPFSASKSYDIIFEANDSFNEATVTSKFLGTGFDLMHFHSSGKSMAIGKKSEASATDQKLEIGLDAYFIKDIYLNGVKILWKE